MQRIKLATLTAVTVALIAAFAFTIHARAYADLPAVGATAPSFTLPAQDEKPVSLADYKGKWVVLYFYPKDMTSGCTIEAHNFQRDLPKYTAANAAVLGVSLDTPDSHRTFCTKESLTFKLLADPNHKVVDAYGVPVKSAGTIQYSDRVTFLISPAGKIVKVWPKVSVNAHSDEVLEAIAAAKK